jgi:hypothetical protein
MLDVSPALPPSGLDEALVVLGREMRRQQADRCQRQVTCLEPFQEHRILADDTSYLNAAVRGVLG